MARGPASHTPPLPWLPMGLQEPDDQNGETAPSGPDPGEGKEGRELPDNSGGAGRQESRASSWFRHFTDMNCVRCHATCVCVGGDRSSPRSADEATRSPKALRNSPQVARVEQEELRSRQPRK